jgi:Rod binding domain-containing protein
MEIGSLQNIGIAQQQAEFGKQDGVLKKVSGVHPDDAKKIKGVARDFEAVFLELMLKSMRNTVPKSELMDGGNGEEIFRSMLDGEYAKAMSQQESYGSIAQAIEKDLLKTMENQIARTQSVRGHEVYRAKSLHPVGNKEKIDVD